MKTRHKIAIVAGGYVFAFLATWAAVALNAALSKIPAADASGGMHAFGDLVLFVGVFACVALLPTGAALYFVFARKGPPGEPPPKPLRPKP